MSLRSVVSVGLFGRLSILAAPRKDVYESIQSVADDLAMRAKPGETLKPLNPANVLMQALPAMLVDLSALIDAIVLSDEILNFCGYDPEYFNELINKHRIAPRNTHPLAFYFTLVWPDEANRLREIALEGLPHTLIGNSNSRLLDAEVLLDFPIRGVPSTFITGALKPSGIDYHYIRQIADERGSGGTREEQEAAYDQILEYVDTYLGEDWKVFRNTVSPEIHWPPALRQYPGLPRHSPAQGLFQLGLFSELEVALERATLGVSSLPAGSYYTLLASQPHVLRSSLRQIAAQAYQKRLLEDLKRFGVVCLDLEIPPILRFCLHGAKDLFEVLENAARLHNDRRIVDLRRHLQEVAQSTNPAKLRRYLLRLDGYTQASLDSFAGLAPAGMGVSTNGESLSLSLSSALVSAARSLLAWRNPVVLVHTKLQHALADVDSIGDLAKILQVSRSVAAEALQASRKLQTPSPLDKG